MAAEAIAAEEWRAARQRSLAFADGWRRAAAHARLAEAFDEAAATDPGIAIARAQAVLADPFWASAMLAPLVAALAVDPLFEPPVKVAREGGRIGAILFDAPAARVAASVVSSRGAGQAAPASVVVPGHVTVTRYVRAGDVRLRRWRAPRLGDADVGTIAGAPAIELPTLAPADGDVLVLDGRTDGQIIAAARCDVVTITVILRAGTAPLMREYRIADGAMVRAAATDDGASRAALLLGFLRAADRTEAGAVFDAASRGRAPHDRWGAVRQWLALDARAALPRLAEMAARDASTEVRAAAAATLALAERRMATACPA